MIFVTGGTGLVGAHLLYELTSKGKKVKALKRKTSNLQQVLKTFSYYSETPNELFNLVEWVDSDILDYFELEKLLGGITEIYHCAAIVSFYPGDRRKMIAGNVDGTSNLVNAALENGIKKICHVSSVAALGRLDNQQPITEETNWVPSKKISGYSESKFFSEAEIWRGIQEGLDAVIVNPSIILGPANWETGSPKIFKTVWDGMKYFTDGITGYVDVKDVARAMVMLMDDTNFETCKNQRYLLSAENLSYRSIFNLIAEELGKPKPKTQATKFMLELGWRAAKAAGFITGKPPLITHEIVNSSRSVNNFDGSKITRQINFSYLPITESIRQTASFLKQDMQNS